MIFTGLINKINRTLSLYVKLKWPVISKLHINHLIRKKNKIVFIPSAFLPAKCIGHFRTQSATQKLPVSLWLRPLHRSLQEFLMWRFFPGLSTLYPLECNLFHYLVWPIRWARAAACRSFCGLKSLSTNMTVSADIKFKPWPPTERKKEERRSGLPSQLNKSKGL